MSYQNRVAKHNRKNDRRPARRAARALLLGKDDNISMTAGMNFEPVEESDKE